MFSTTKTPNTAMTFRISQSFFAITQSSQATLQLLPPLPAGTTSALQLLLCHRYHCNTNCIEAPPMPLQSHHQWNRYFVCYSSTKNCFCNHWHCILLLQCSPVGCCCHYGHFLFYSLVLYARFYFTLFLS